MSPGEWGGGGLRGMKEVQSMTNQRWWQRATMSAELIMIHCVLVKEKVNSGEKYHNKSPLGILWMKHYVIVFAFVSQNNNESRRYANKQIRRINLHCLLQGRMRAPAPNPFGFLIILSESFIYTAAASKLRGWCGLRQVCIDYHWLMGCVVSQSGAM